MTDHKNTGSDSDGEDIQEITFGSEIPKLDVDISEVDYLLTSLGVLTSLNIGDKLVWNDDECMVPNIQYVGPFRSVKRFWWVQGRKDCIMKLREIVYKSISALKFESASVRIKESLIKVVSGFTNLKTTYQHDKMVASQIEIIIQNIQKTISEGG